MPMLIGSSSFPPDVRQVRRMPSSRDSFRRNRVAPVSILNTAAMRGRKSDSWKLLVTR